MSYEYDDFEDFYGETMEDHYSDYADENWWADREADDADEYDDYCDDESEDFHADEATGYVDPFEDGPFLD